MENLLQLQADRCHVARCGGVKKSNRITPAWVPNLGPFSLGLPAILDNNLDSSAATNTVLENIPTLPMGPTQPSGTISASRVIVPLVDATST